METITLSNGDLLLIVTESTWRDCDWSKRAWRIRNGQAIAMVRFFTDQNESVPGKALICDIEVRREFRGNGLGISTIQAIESYIGTRLYTSGGFTPKGFRSLSHYLPCHSDLVAGEHFRDMNFVSDWNDIYIDGYTLEEVLNGEFAIV